MENETRQYREFRVRDVADGFGSITHFEITREDGELSSLTDFQIYVANASAEVLMSDHSGTVHDSLAYVLHYAMKGMEAEGVAVEDVLPNGITLGDYMLSSVQHAVSLGICHACGKNPETELVLTDEQSNQLNEYNRRKLEEIDRLHAAGNQEGGHA